MKPKYKRSGYKMIDRDTIHFIDVYGEVIKTFSKGQYNNILLWNSVISQAKDYPLGSEIVYYNDIVMNEMLSGSINIEDLIAL